MSDNQKMKLELLRIQKRNDFLIDKHFEKPAKLDAYIENFGHTGFKTGSEGGNTQQLKEFEN